MGSVVAAAPRVTASRKLIVAAAIAALSAAALASMELRGRAARVRFDVPVDLGAHRAAMVHSATDALRVWADTGVRGRRLVILSGQWAKPSIARTHPSASATLASTWTSSAQDPSDAIFASTRLGIVRSLDVVMPPASFSRRLEEVSSTKVFVREEEAFRTTYSGLERRFSTPQGFVAPDEPVLVLIEPSWYAEGAPLDPLRWLASRGVTWDLALLALADLSATDAERLAASSYGRALGARFVEVRE